MLTTNSGAGDPHAATAQKGQELTTLVVERIGQFLCELAQSPLGRRISILKKPVRQRARHDLSKSHRHEPPAITRPGILFLAGSLFSGCWLLPGCGPAAGPASFSTPPAKKQQNRNQGQREVDYHLKGVVKKVDPASGKLMIAHEAIEGFMDAMTMPFPYQDRAVLEDVRVGDVVEGTLHVVFADGVVSDYELRELVVAKPAPAPMVIDVSKGKVTLRKAPRLLEVGEAVPDFAMTTQEGKPLEL